MSTTGPELLLDAQGLAKRYGGVRAVVDGRLQVGRGEMVGLIGPNGCGKSTTLKMIAGIEAPDAGTLVFDGEPLPTGDYRATRDRGILLVAQELALAPDDKVWESVVLGSETTRGGFVDRRACRRRAAEALAILGHDLPLDAAVSTLTPVERRLITIARGAAHEGVRLLILDEPTAGLPQEEAVRIITAMRNLVASDRSIILVSHHIEDIVSACSSVTLMRDGRYVQTLTGDDVEKDGIVQLLLAGVAGLDESLMDIDRTPTTTEVVGAADRVSGEFLDDVSLRVHRGEIVGVAGLLGAGTAEVVRMFTGQSQPTSGAVALGTGGVSPKAPHQAFGAGIGFVTGDRASVVIPPASVSEHVALPALARFKRAGFLSKRRQRTWVRSALDDLAVKGDPEALMTSLSGGNQQRALMSRWVGSAVDLLVVDNPTVGVDMAGRRQLLEVLRGLRSGRGVLLATEPEELAVISDRVLCFKRGRLTEELTGADISEARILAAIA